MEFGIASGFETSGEDLGSAIREAAEAAEAAGSASFWTLGDREIARGRGYDPTVCLHRVARATSGLRVVLGGDATCVRAAALRAKQLASLDWFAGGRLEVTADLADAPDLQDVPGPEDRDLAAERWAAMRSLWTDRRAAHDGSYVRFRGAIALPKPVGGRVPLTHVRVDIDAAVERIRPMIDRNGPPAGWVSWGDDDPGPAMEAIERALGLGEAGLRRTWCVPSDRHPRVRETAAASGVDELVAVFTTLPSAAEVEVTLR